MGPLEDARPPGPARDLVDLLAELRRRTPLTLGQLVAKTGLSRSYLSEILRGLKTPSPDVTTRLAEALGADPATVAKAVRYAEALAELNSYHRRRSRQSAPEADQRESSLPRARLPAAWLAGTAAAVLVLAFGALLVFRPAGSGSSAAITGSSAAITGRVTCDSGRPVIAVWIAALSGQQDSGFAHLGAAVPGQIRPEGPTVTYSFRLAHGGGYIAHVGCGGKSGDWASTNFSPVITGQAVTLSCADPDSPHPAPTTLTGTCST